MSMGNRGRVSENADLVESDDERSLSIAKETKRLEGLGLETVL